MNPMHLPTAAQIGAYLTARGWRYDRPMKEPGAVYVYHERTARGEPVELFVPDEHGMEFNARGRSVMAVVDLVKDYEARSRQAVLADMLATAPTGAPASVA